MRKRPFLPNWAMRKSREPALVKLQRPPPQTRTLMPGREFFSKRAMPGVVGGEWSVASCWKCSAAASAAIMPAAPAPRIARS